MKRFSLYILYILLLVVASPYFVHAATVGDINDPKSRVSQVGFEWTKNGSRNLDKVISDLWTKSVDSVLLPLFGGLAVLFLIYAGIQYIMAQGNAEQTKKARQSIINILVGVIFVITAFALINLVTGVAHFFAIMVK